MTSISGVLPLAFKEQNTHPGNYAPSPQFPHTLRGARDGSYTEPDNLSKLTSLMMIAIERG